VSTEALLSRLDRVRQTGAGRWIARCPAHEDRSPSLNIRELDDGRVLMHDFGGCSIEQVLVALGVGFDALYPPRPIANGRPERKPFFPADVFEIARREIGVVAVIACDMHKNQHLSEEDYQRLFLAIERLNDIAGAAYAR